MRDLSETGKLALLAIAVFTAVMWAVVLQL